MVTDARRRKAEVDQVKREKQFKVIEEKRIAEVKANETSIMNLLLAAAAKSQKQPNGMAKAVSMKLQKNYIHYECEIVILFDRYMISNFQNV